MTNTAYTVESLAEEQDSLRLDTFNYDIAWRLGEHMRAEAVRRDLRVAITIAHGPDLVFVTLTAGATPDNLGWAARKRAVSQRFHKSSLAMRLFAERGQFDFNERFRLPSTDFAASGGGVPLMLKNGVLVATAGVSGLPDAEDHTLIVDAIRSSLL